MFKPILLCLCTFFLLIVKAQNLGVQDYFNNNLSKSFTAICENSSNCTYSLVLSNTNSTGPYDAAISIFVGAENVFSNEITVTNANPVTINFNVTQGSQIGIMFITTTPETYMRFQLYNQADGKGEIVQDSQSLQFLVWNACALESCTLSFSRSPSWVPNVVSNFKINGTIVATVDNTVATLDITYKPFDIMSIEVVGNPSDIVDGLMVVAFAEELNFLIWYSNSYFTPMLATANCLAPPAPIHSPFGGPLVPVTQEEIDLFVKTIGTSYSTLWYRETVNFDLI